MSFTFILLLLTPIMIAIISKYYLDNSISWGEFSIHCLVAVLASLALWNLSLYTSTYDEKLNNGYIVEKVKVKSSHLESRSCGKRCTKTVTVYTTDWSLKTTVGEVYIEHARTESIPLAWSLPDPSEYKTAIIGQYAGKTEYFENLLRNAPDSIFHTDILTSDEKVPEYPELYGIYRYNHLVIGKLSNEFQDISKLEKLSDKLRDIQRNLETSVYNNKDINILVYLTDSNSRTVRYSVERAWKYGKKNDVIVYVSVNPETEELNWVDVGTWLNSTGNETYTVKLRDSLSQAKTLDQFIDTQLKSSLEETSQYYTVFDDKKLEYIKDNMEPPFWLTVTIFSVMILLNLWLTRFFHVNDFGEIYSFRDINWI